MPRAPVQVYIRTRPTANFASENLTIDPVKRTVAVHVPKARDQHVNNQLEDWRFQFDRILHNVSQEEVYEAVGDDLVARVLEGYNGTILAYGQTGAGKTFTMSGGVQSFKYRGLIPRAISHIFALIASKPETAFTVRCSFLEIYNEQFYDLLRDDDQSSSPAPSRAAATAAAAADESTGTAGAGDLAVMDDERGNVTVRGLRHLVVTSEEEALGAFFAGETNRAVAQHQMNVNSTRSHCIFTVHLEARSRVESSEKVVVSKLNLVDLAGSERVKKTGSSGAILNEAKYINKSLAFLEQVVLALSSSTRDHVPFRQSKLTNVLRDSLGGNCMTRLVANVWCEQAQLFETISTLKFATRMLSIANEVSVNVQLDPQLLLRKYERDLQRLKQELAMQDTLAGRTGVSYDEEFTPEEQAALRHQVCAYIDGSLAEIDIVNLRQIRELFRQFRGYVREVQASAGTAAARSAGGLGGASSASSSRAASSAEGKVSEAKSDGAGGANASGGAGGAHAGGMVGDLDDDSNGFHIGVVPTDARPPSSAALHLGKHDDPNAALRSPKSGAASPAHAATAASTAASPKAGASSSASATTSTTTATAAVGKATASTPSEAEALAIFQAGEGAPKYEAFQQCRASVAAAREKHRVASGEAAELKKAIDELTVRVQLKRDAREHQARVEGAGAAGDDVEVIDEEEYALIRECRDKRTAYKAALEQLKMLAGEANYGKQLERQAKLELAHSFLQWYQSEYGGEGAAPSTSVATAPASLRRQVSVDGDAKDPDEQFRELEHQRLVEEDPDSVPYFTAFRKATDVPRKAGAASIAAPSTPHRGAASAVRH